MYLVVEDYIVGELEELASEHGYRMKVEENNDLTFIHKGSNPYAPIIKAKFELDINGDSFWYTPDMKVSFSNLYDVNFSYSYIAELFSNAAVIADYLQEATWYIE